MIDAVHAPGVTLSEVLADRGISQVELSEQTDLPQELIHEIVQGDEPITPFIALSLQQVLDIPASFWLSLERQYREAEDQRRSFVYGNVRLANDGITRELVDEVADEMDKR